MSNSLQQQDQEAAAAGTGAPRVTLQSIEDRISSVQYSVYCDTLTLCVIRMVNGFTFTGESACVSPANFNAEFGRKLSYEKAISKAWGYEAYLLAEKEYVRSL